MCLTAGYLTECTVDVLSELIAAALRNDIMRVPAPAPKKQEQTAAEIMAGVEKALKKFERSR